jgi:nucleoside-diphosphate-sugar epimerase
MRILVAGCGDVGSEFASLAVDAGHDIFGLRRSMSRVPGGVTPVVADLSRPQSLANLPQVECVVFCAAPDRRDEEGYRGLYVDGQRNLLAAVQSGVRWMFVSSTAVYGQTDGQWVDEDADTQPPGYNGTIMLEAESLAGAAGSESTIVRLGGVYGPGRERLIRLVRDGEARCPQPPRWTNRIHRDDAARALLHLLDQPATIYNGVDDYPAADAEVYDWLADQLGVDRPPRVDNPSGVAKRVSNARLRATGFRFVYPDFRSGYGQLLGKGTC